MPLPGEPPSADLVAPRGTPAWKKAVLARRRWVADMAWRQNAAGRLDLGSPDAVSTFLASLGITGEIGGGRHQRRLFMGDLPSEGWGMGTGMSRAMEYYMPEWKWRQIKGWPSPGPPGGPAPGGGASGISSTAPNPAAPFGGDVSMSRLGGATIEAPSFYSPLMNEDEDPWEMARRGLRQRGGNLGTLAFGGDYGLS